MICVLFGAPGAGKGTQAAMLASRLGAKVIGTGAILRKEIEAGSEIGQRAQEAMDAGKLVSDEILVEILAKNLKGHDSGLVVLDGFPRNVAQAEALTQIAKVGLVVELEVSEDEIVRRLTERKVCSECQRIFGGDQKGDSCPECSGRLERRNDDNSDKVRVRLHEYRTKTAPVIGFYKGNPGLVRVESVDGEGGAEDLHQKLVSMIKGLAN